MVNANSISLPQLPAQDDAKPVVVEDKGIARVVTLNRPRVLNCLNHEMVLTIIKHYEEWEIDENVHFVVVKGNGRVFCAGGDLRMFFNAKKGDDSLSTTEVIYCKYWLDYHVGTYKKPLIALWTGLVMGGGAGLTVPGRFRVATEKAVFSMPEAALGLHTDCGSSFWLSWLPGHLGEYLALTGHRLDGAEMLTCGLATHFVPLQRLPELEKQLYELTSGDLDTLQKLLDEFSIPTTPGERSILHRTSAIDNLFCKDSVEDILAALEAQFNELAEDWVKEVIKIIKRSSPTGLKVTFNSIREARKKTWAECLRTEYRLTINAIKGTISNDFYEGIRAIVVDKDNKPKWNPTSLQEVTPEDLKLVFQPFKESLELQLQDPRWSGNFLQTASHVEHATQ
ncbi:unnamed protein product [Sphagnum compactum]